MQTRRNVKLLSGTFLIVMFLAASLSAADVVIRGVVTDAVGKPIRAALVKVTMETKTVSRLTRKDGRFEITVPAGTYDVSAEAHGFGVKREKKDTTQAGELNFKLSPRIDVMRLTSADIESLLPDTEELVHVKAACQTCHGFQVALKGKGWTAAQWAEFLPRMAERRFGGNGGFGSPARVALFAPLLEKYFGPTAPVFGPDAEPPALSQIKHTEPSDAALRATVTEWQPPYVGGFAHSVALDNANGGTVWYTSYDVQNNNLTRFDPETEKFTVYPIPVPKSNPHTGAIMKDGSFIVALAGRIDAKLAQVDRAGNMKLHEWPDKRDVGGHTAFYSAATDRVWITNNSPDEVWAFDVKTGKFRAYKYPVVTAAPEGSQAVAEVRRGGALSTGAYDIAADSKGIAWISQMQLGSVIRLDPTTGETKTYHTPAMRSARGITVDEKDNVWWGDYYGHGIGKLDAQTGAIKVYKAPSLFAAPYGVFPDRKNGYMWYADLGGDKLTRFDPRTETFVEFPLPTINTGVRFDAVDTLGRVWYSGFWSGKMGVLDPEGGPSGSKSTSQQ